MNQILSAIQQIRGKIGQESIRIHGKDVSEELIYKKMLYLGEKRKFKDLREYTIKRSLKSCILPITDAPLTQWQTVAYYSIISKKYMSQQEYNLFFVDLDLLETKDHSIIDDYHCSSCLLQTPDLPYCYIERDCLSIQDDDSYDADIDNIVDFVREEIDKGYYIAIELDDFFVKHNPYHAVLRSFVFGYDDQSNVFHCTGFINNIFQEYEVNYTAFVQGYEYGKLLNLQAPVFLERYKPRSEMNFEPSEEILRRKLKSYFESTGRYNYLQGESKVGRWENCFEYTGFQASKRFIDLLEEKITNDEVKVCYQCVHALFEHTIMINERLNHLSGLKNKELLQKIVFNSNAARLFFLKYIFTVDKRNLVECVAYFKKTLKCEEAFFDKNFYNFI